MEFILIARNFFIWSVSSTNGASMEHRGSLLHNLVVACNLLATTWLWASTLEQNRSKQSVPQPGCGSFLRATTHLWQLVLVAFESPIWIKIPSFMLGYK